MYNEIVAHFRDRQRNHPEEYISYCIAQDSLSETIKVSAMAINQNGKINSHQRRVGRKNLENFASTLVIEESKIAKAKSFDELLAIVENIKSERIGLLTKYDTALRIGAWLKLYPDKIYLHAGTKIGAVYIIGHEKVKSRKFITMDELPQEILQYDLTASDFEDILCNYKTAFKDGFFTPKDSKAHSLSSC